MKSTSALKIGVLYIACFLSAILIYAIRYVGDWRALSILIILAISISTWIVFLPRLSNKIENCFLLLAIPTLSMLCIAMPITASVSWDGQIHFDASRALTQTSPSRYTRADALMANADSIYELGLYPYGMTEDDWTPNWNSILSQEAYEHSVEEIERSSEIQSANIIDEFTRISGSSVWSVNIWGRIPNAIGLALGQLLNMPQIIGYYLGRFTGACTYILIMYLAFKNLKQGKLVLLSVALLPTLLFLAANYSYDPTLIALIAYSTTRYIGILQDDARKMTLSDGILILLPLTIGILAKAILFPAMLVFLFIPKSKFEGKHGALIWRIGVSLAVLYVMSTFITPFFVTSGAAYNDSRGGENISTVNQIKYILMHPLDYISTLVRWAVSYLSPASLSEATVSLCYLPLPFGWYVMSALEWLCIFSTSYLDTSNENPLTSMRGSRIGISIFLCGAYLLMATSLYLGFTPVGAFDINGMQPRYLLMLLYPILALLCHSDRLSRAPWTDRISKHLSNAIPLMEGLLCAYLIVAGFLVNF